MSDRFDKEIKALDDLAIELIEEGHRGAAIDTLEAASALEYVRLNTPTPAKKGIS
jgi:hypothetical protein